MKAEENAIELTTFDRSDDRVAEPLECGPLDLATWPRRRTQDMFDMPIVRAARIKEASQLRIGIASCSDRIVSHQHIAVSERLFAGQMSTEGIGLVRELCGEDPECHPVALLEGAGSAARAIGGWPATAWPPSAAERRGVSISMCLSRLMNPFSVLPYSSKISAHRNCPMLHGALAS